MRRGLPGATPLAGDHRALPTRFGGFGASQSTSTLSYLAEPPSLTAVSDPHVVVLIKNILKKDSTTKARALEELLNHVQGAAEGVEDGLLDIWVEIYPRVSIDNSRRVRELSHTLQYELLKAGRKRMERRLSGIVATWIAGLFDRDRSVSRAANTGLASFLNTPEKMNAFWLKCHSQILDFAIDSIRETPDTLSDERSTTKEDAEAKYYRVVYASLCLVNGLLQRASSKDLSNFQAKYEDYFGGDAVWKNIQSPDSSVRRAVCHLMFACLDRDLPYVEPKAAKQAFLVGGLQTNHSGTALEYVRALSKLTQAQPQIWNSAEGKKSPKTRLLAFIAKGSQGSPPMFWEKLDQLLQSMPVEDTTLDLASDLSNAIQKGITHRAEPKTNTSSAWKCFIDTAKRLLLALSPEDQLSFASSQLFPLFERFFFSPPGSTAAIPLGPNSLGILVEAQKALMQGSANLQSALEEEWKRLSTMLCENVSGALPEVSKDFILSQERLGEEGRRWFGLLGEMQRAKDGDLDLTTVVNGPSTTIITHCLDVLQKRNLKPFGAARVVEFALSSSAYLFEENTGQEVLDFLSSIESIGMKLFVDSPSMSSILSSVRLLIGQPPHRAAVVKIWKSWAASVVAMPSSDARDAAFISLISSDDISESVQKNDDIQAFILKSVREGTQSEPFLSAIVKHDALSPQTARTLVDELVQGLDTASPERLSKLQSLETLIKAKPALVKEEDTHTLLVRQLLSLEELEDAQISAKATTIRSLMSGNPDGAHLPVVSIIQQNLEAAGPQCLSIDTLVQQAQDALKGGASLEDIFPSTNAFMQSLLPFLERPVDPSLGIMNVTGGAVLLVSPDDSPSRPPPRDSYGRSIPVRMALYVCHLLDSDSDISTLPPKFQVELLYLQGLVLQLVSDQISLLSEDGLWKSLEPAAALEQAMWLVSASRSQLLDITRSCDDWPESADEESHTMPQLLELLTRESRVLTPTALYSSRILSEIMQTVVEREGIPSAWEQKFLSPEALKIGPDTVLVTTAVLTGFGDTLRSLKSINTLCNRLVSDIAAAKVSSDKTIILLTLLTLCGAVYDSGTLPIPSNRIVFAVKQVADWFDDGSELSPEFASECLKCLTPLLPCIKDVYGSFWEKTLQFCVASCENASNYPLNRVLPLLHASLRLLRDLSEMAEVNDDLEESLSDISKQKAAVLIELLRLDREVATQPLEIVDRLLCREVEKLSTSQLPEPEELYSLVASESATLQTTAFVLLHRIVPEQQQRKSVNIMLDNLNARLPDELLSLLLDAPTLEQFTDEMLASFPVSVRGYLLSWKLIFDAYAASPFKIRADFTEGLKAENPLGPLLDFMFDVLGHSAGYPLKLEKEGILPEQIRHFDVKLADAELEEKSMHWLMAHLFYLILKYIPGLFRTWYQDCRSKQTKMAVESWTESFFSTLVIEDALDDVQTWLDSDDFNSSNEADIGVKVSKSGKEVTITYEIDESEGAMAIKLPNNFPIEGVTARGIRRVAVNERKWQSWIMTTQGVITFANGNIIDGVQAFRRNLTGAIRGHSECAICYSVISADQRVPEKSCTTCKNLFHRLCLYKWFQTSNNNTCPLCRTPIDFAGASNIKRRN